MPGRALSKLLSPSTMLTRQVAPFRAAVATRRMQPVRCVTVQRPAAPVQMVASFSTVLGGLRLGQRVDGKAD